MITLTNVSSTYGAPMGRPDEGNICHAHTAAVEWMPLVDGAYDCGGAYWGSGAPMYCVVGYEEDGTEECRAYHRAANRDFLINDLQEIHCFEGTYLPETGSIVKQTIEKYQGLITDDVPPEWVEEIEQEISLLESWLDEKGLA